VTECISSRSFEVSRMWMRLFEGDTITSPLCSIPTKVVRVTDLPVNKIPGLVDLYARRGIILDRPDFPAFETVEAGLIPVEFAYFTQ
jgi:hypothetical protein